MAHDGLDCLIEADLHGVRYLPSRLDKTELPSPFWKHRSGLQSVHGKEITWNVYLALIEPYAFDALKTSW